MSPEPQAPKGTVWLVIARQPGMRATLVQVENIRHGLTAFEAWRDSSVPVAFHQAEVIQLHPYPIPSDITKEKTNGKVSRLSRMPITPGTHVRPGLSGVRKVQGGEQDVARGPGERGTSRSANGPVGFDDYQRRQSPRREGPKERT